MSAGRRAARAAKRAADSVWADRVARLGFCCRGLVYGIIGAIALQIAWGDQVGARNDANKNGALREISERSLGGALLVVLAVGLGGYALWRGSEAVWGDRDEDDERKRTARRLTSAGKAAFYAVFMASTVRFTASGPSGGHRGDEQEETLTARVLDLPAGRLLVIAIGVVVVAYGAHAVYRGVTQRFEKRLDTSAMGRVTGRVIDVVGTVGLGARGLVFALAGFLLVRAAVDYDADEAAGLDGTLELIARQTYGRALLTATALGIITYGVYSLAEARYREL
ncbi:MAG: DUF1206 domain-containing protein [Acidimicrobiales bacterium]|nr:DUF1206 domain-containing protein [Acidimicrobiales bacterium]